MAEIYKEWNVMKLRGKHKQSLKDSRKMKYKERLSNSNLKIVPLPLWKHAALKSQMLTMSMKSLLFTLITKVNIQSRVRCSRSGGYEQLYIFLHTSPCSPLKVNQRFGRTSYLHLQGGKINQALLAACFKLVPCLAHSSTLKMKETCSSETSVDFQRITRR
jgi:hypothetical protein